MDHRRETDQASKAAGNGPNDSLPKVSVIIRAYNEAGFIGRLLDGLMQQTLRDIEIILVDSGSTDDTVAIARRYPVKILSIRPEDFSFGHSLNVGCREASGAVLVIASAHVYPTHRDWLERLVAPFANHEVALVYGRQRGAETTRYAEHRIFERWFPDRSDPDQRHPFCNNANAAIRRSLWQKLPYDESLTGLEDLDWAQRAQALGGRIIYDCEATVVHVHHETPARVYNRYRREAIALKSLYPASQFSLIDFARLFIGNVVSDWVHAAHAGKLARHWWEIIWFRWMQFAGTWSGKRFAGSLTQSLRRTFYYPGRLRPTDQPESPERKGLRINYDPALAANDRDRRETDSDADRRARAHAS